MAVSRELRQLGQRLGGRAGEHRMQHVVDAGQRLRRGEVAAERAGQRVAVRGKGHVADRGHAAGDRRGRSAAEVVDPGRLAGLVRRRRQVHVHVQAARQDQRPGRVQLPAAARRPADLADPAVADAQVALGRAARGHHGSAADDQVAVVDGNRAHLRLAVARCRVPGACEAPSGWCGLLAGAAVRVAAAMGAGARRRRAPSRLAGGSRRAVPSLDRRRPAPRRLPRP